MVIKKDIKKPKALVEKKERYHEAVGGRKTARARVRLFNKTNGFTINGKDLKEYFRIPKHQFVAISPLKTVNLLNKVGVTVKVQGGGLNAQAEAVRHGVARALVMLDEQFKKNLRHAGFITRDQRKVERKKYGLKKARRAPQWAKR